MIYDLKDHEGNKLEKAEVFLPPMNPIGLQFELEGVRYKILNCFFKAFIPDPDGKHHIYNNADSIGTLVVTTLELV